jgi:hypothetical protein
MTSSNCSRCGKAASGNFCQHCGASLTPGFCTKCGEALSGDSDFCPKCGAQKGTGSGGGVATGGGSSQTNWVVPAGILVVAVAIALFFLMRINNGGSTVGLPPQGVNTAALPDLSQMSPEERFDRLYNRVMQAAEQGDAATMQQFSPMALSAYGMLDEVDADARYHAALLKLHTGDVAGSAALADSIEADTPSHLFGFIIRGTLAKWQNDPAALAQVYSEFLAAYDEEIAVGRPEYDEHERSVQGFLEDARGGGG